MHNKTERIIFVEKSNLINIMTENIDCGLIFINEGNEITFFNEIAEVLTGFTPEEAIGKNIDDVLWDLYDSINLNHNSSETMNQKAAKKITNMKIVPVKDENEDRIGAVIFLKNVAEQKLALELLNESEKSKAVLLSNLPGMAYRTAFNRGYTMLFVSDACYELTGYKAEDLLKNQNFKYEDIVMHEFREALWETIALAVEKKTKFTYEYQIIDALGNIKWVWEQGQGIYDKKGNAIALEGFILDITERKIKEERIKFLIYHDSLTGLSNRLFCEEEILRLDTENHLPLSVIIGDVNGLKIINDAFGHSEGDQLLIEISKILLKCTREDDIVARTGGDEFCILLPNTDSKSAQAIISKIDRACKIYDNKKDRKTFCANISLAHATKTNISESIDLIRNVAEENMYRKKLFENKSIHNSIISSIKITMFEKDKELEKHSERLKLMSEKIGEALELDDARINDLVLLATLHDIGKISIDSKILNKTTKLSDEEWTEIKKHPEVGFRIAQATSELRHISEYIFSHHERWDGKGYPQGLCGEEIPLLSRIISVLDAYDAMTQDRIYRKAMSKEAAVTEILINAGTQFDPDIAKVFIEKVINKLIIIN